MEKKFNVKKLAKLNDPKRLEFQNPDTIWNTLELGKPEVVVDIGAGTGFFAIPFSQRMEKGRLYACDIADEMIEWMDENIIPKYGNKITTIKMSENTVDIPDTTADLVYMINLHHELDDASRMLSEISRILKPGGKLMIIDWKKEVTPLGPPVAIRIEESDIRRQMESRGFEDIISYQIMPYHYMVVGRK